MRRDPAGTGENESAASPVIESIADHGSAVQGSAVWGVVAAAVVGALLPQTWFRRGTFIATGDTFPMLQGLRGVTRLWGTEFTGTGSTGFPSSQLLERGMVQAVD